MRFNLPNLRQRLAGFIAAPGGQRSAVSGQPANPFSAPVQGSAAAPRCAAGQPANPFSAPVQAAGGPPAVPLHMGMQRIIRPEAAARWGILPQLGSITPQYIEQTLRGAMSGAHVAQWELFDLMKDTWPRLLKNDQELKRGALAMDFKLEAGAEDGEAPSPEAQARLALVKRAMRGMQPRAGWDENGWEGTLHDILDAWTMGTSVLELLDWRELKGDVLPRATYWVHPTNYAWAREGFLGLANSSQRSAVSGQPFNSQLSTLNSGVSPFPDHKFLVAVCKAKAGHPLAGALLRPLAWWWCASNFSADWLLGFAEVFGLPIRWAHYPAGTPQATIDGINAMLQNMGHRAWANFPEGVQVELKESSKGGTGTLPQEGLLDRADKQCDLLLLGQTLTSDTGNSGAGGGSLALGEVHAGVRDQIILSAARFAANVLNEQFIPSLLLLNYGDTGFAPRFYAEPRRVEDMKGNAERDAILLRERVEFPKAWFYERHKIPLPQDGEEVIGGQPSAVSGQPFGQEPEVSSLSAGGDGRGEVVPPPAVTAAASQLSTFNSQLRSGFAAAVADDLRFALDRLARIAEINDPALFEAKLREFAQDFPQLKADVLADPKSARALLPALVKGLEQGLSKPAVQGGESNPDQARDDQGQFASSGGGAGAASGPGGGGSVEAPAQSQLRGAAAMEKAITHRADVIGAMQHPVLGSVDFRWGDSRKGLQHIMERRDAQKARFGTGPSGGEMLRAIPGVIAHGKVTYERGDAVVEHGGNRVILTKRWDSRPSAHWVLNAYDVDERKGRGR